MADDFGASELGTRKYWDKIYQRDLVNNLDNSDDIGEIWFGEGAERRMIRWLKDNLNSCTMNVKQETRILELGCGNGHLLNCLYETGVGINRKLKLVGVDYSAAAVELAQRLTDDSDCAPIEFRQLDLLDEKQCADLILCYDGRPFDVLLDKGTLDAISLQPKSDDDENISCKDTGRERDREVLKKYVNHAAMLCTEQGILIITSCNWTEKELTDIMDPWFQPLDSIKHPSHTFGGRQGQTVSTIVFRRRMVRI